VPGWPGSRISAGPCRLLLLLLGMGGWAFPAASLVAGSWELAGQATLRGGWNTVSGESLFQPVTGRDFPDGSAEIRLMPQWQVSTGNRFLLHYEAVVMKSPLPELSGGLPLPLAGGLPGDRTRLLRLTRVLDGQGEWRSWHRLDRLAWRYATDWGSLTVGRSALTWGNGLVFNPLDLFNPFAPTDVERDYKLGDDLLHVLFHPAAWNGGMEWQLLAVPRRNPVDESVEAASSSLALKVHRFMGPLEADALLALHYDEPVVGLGLSGYLGGAVWRWDAAATFDTPDGTLFSTVANLDTSWTLMDRNWYGSIELHYNTMGSSDYETLPGNTVLLERLARGEVFTLGRAYLASTLQVELHPLLNLYLTGIANLEDPSGVVLPKLVWSARQNLEVTLGGRLSLGAAGTEFGGIRLPGTTRTAGSPDRLFLWIQAFF